MVGILITFLLIWVSAYFRGQAVSFREGNHPKKGYNELPSNSWWFFTNPLEEICASLIGSFPQGVKPIQLLSSSTHLLHPVQSLTAPRYTPRSGPARLLSGHNAPTYVKW